MITNKTYYKNEIYIPNAKPSITSDVTSVSAELNDFVEKYERECLIKCLGYQLYKEFADVLDSTKANGLKDGTDVKWDELLNGKEYTNPSGDLVYWRGIRHDNTSFLANYVYCNYEENFDSFRTGVGNVKPKGANSYERSPAQKVVRAWREMVDIIQGKEFRKEIITKHFGYAVDYYSDNSEVTLYKFIEDTNYTTPNTYANFKPGFWENKNQFGI